MGERFSFGWRNGFTVIELMVTVFITAILAATLGVFFVKLLNIHEQEREEAYVREKLVEVCGSYADQLSIASSATNGVIANGFAAYYRQETGGVSLETGRVSRVTELQSYLDTDDKTLDLKIGSRDRDGKFNSRFSRTIRGDALLMNLMNDMDRIDNQVWKLTPLNTEGSLFYLSVAARCKCMSDKRKETYKSVTAGRIVRLWNFEK